MADEFDDLMGDFGRRPSVLKRVSYFILALTCVVPTTALFAQVFLIDLRASTVTLALGVAVNTALLSLAYHNLSFAKAARVRRVAAPPTKGAFKGRTDEFKRAQAAFEGRISGAALWFSAAYNNAIFMIVAPLLGVYLLSEKLSGDLNMLVSGAAAAGLALFNSNTALKAIGEAQ